VSPPRCCHPGRSALSPPVTPLAVVALCLGCVKHGGLAVGTFDLKLLVDLP